MFIPEPVEKINYAAIAIADVLTFAVRCAIWHIYGKMSFGISLMVNFQLTFFARSVKFINIAAECFKLLLTFGHPICILTLHYSIKFKDGVSFTFLKCWTFTPLAGDSRHLFQDVLFCRFSYSY